MVGVTSRFCANFCCRKCLRKRRRNPENQKEFVRICVDCENLFLRKTLFEEFWNQKERKEQELRLKQEEKKELEKAIELREEDQREIERKKSESVQNEEKLDEVNRKVLWLQAEINRAQQEILEMTKDQMGETDRIAELNKDLSLRKEAFEKLKNQKEFFKSQQIKNMHRKQDLKLKINFFLEKVIEKNEIDEEMLRQKRTQVEDSEVSEPSQMRIRYSDVSLSEHEKVKLTKKKKKYRKKNAKLDDAESSCGNCKRCRIF